jgi:hypothetical protein
MDPSLVAVIFWSFVSYVRERQALYFYFFWRIDLADQGD